MYFLLLPLLSHLTSALLQTPPLAGCKVPRHSRIVPCYCDSQCEFFGDCCHKFAGSPKDFSCVKLSEIHVNSFASAFVVNKCPTGTASELKRKCETSPRNGSPPELVVPVQEARGHKLFKNAFCALCHRAEVPKTPIHVKCRRRFRNITASFETSSQKYLSRGICKLEIPGNYRRGHHAVSACRRSVTYLGRLSNSKLAILRSKDAMCRTRPTLYTYRTSCEGRVFRNPSCLTCNLPLQSCKRPAGAITREHEEKDRLPGSDNDLRFSYRILTNLRHLFSSASPRNVSTNTSEDTSSNSSTNGTSNTPSSLEIAENVVSWIACATSILALLLLLLAHALLPVLKTFGGLLVCSLASSLLLGLVCFLVGQYLPHASTSCRSVGALMYFGYLSSFLWMFLFALDLLRTLRSSVASSLRRKMHRRYLRYSILGWIVPFLLSLSALLMDMFWPASQISPRFGENICYFNTGIGLLFWFYIPVAALVLVNFALTSCLVRTVRRRRQETKAARPATSNQAMVHFSLKLVAISGLTWLVGLINAWFDNSYLGLISILLDGLQGCFICLVFLASSRVVRNAQKMQKSKDQVKITSSTDSRPPASARLVAIREQQRKLDL